MRSSIYIVKCVSLEVITFCVLLSPIKTLNLFEEWFDCVLKLMREDYVSDVAVRFDEDISLNLRWIFDSTTSNTLFCKRDMEGIVFCE